MTVYLFNPAAWDFAGGDVLGCWRKVGFNIETLLEMEKKQSGCSVISIAGELRDTGNEDDDVDDLDIALLQETQAQSRETNVSAVSELLVDDGSSDMGVPRNGLVDRAAGGAGQRQTSISALFSEGRQKRRKLWGYWVTKCIIFRGELSVNVLFLVNARYARGEG